MGKGILSARNYKNECDGMIAKVSSVVLINEKNDRTFTRVYRLCAFFEVHDLYAVDCPAKLRGNLFSAKDRVKVVRCSIERFKDMQGSNFDVRYVLCHPFIGNNFISIPDEVKEVSVICDCNRTGTPSWIWDKVVSRFHVHKKGIGPELCTDQAVAIALHEMTKNV